MLLRERMTGILQAFLGREPLPANPANSEDSARMP
jgi:hypothetical protein